MPAGLKWMVEVGGGEISVVWPIDDLREHDRLREDCWCRPRWDENILVHNAADRREEYEKGRRMS